MTLSLMWPCTQAVLGKDEKFKEVDGERAIHPPRNLGSWAAMSTHQIGLALLTELNISSIPSKYFSELVF